PEVQGVTHFPDDARWQLRDPPLDRGEFFRQPMLRADFFAEGFELLSPRRSQVTVAGSLEVLLRDSRPRYLLAHSLRPDAGKRAAACASGHTSEATAPARNDSGRVMRPGLRSGKRAAGWCRTSICSVGER